MAPWSNIFAALRDYYKKSEVDTALAGKANTSSLGTMSSQNANAVGITGGSATLHSVSCTNDLSSPSIIATNQLIGVNGIVFGGLGVGGEGYPDGVIDGSGNAILTTLTIGGLSIGSDGAITSAAAVQAASFFATGDSSVDGNFQVGSLESPGDVSAAGSITADGGVAFDGLMASSASSSAAGSVAVDIATTDDFAATGKFLLRVKNLTTWAWGIVRTSASAWSMTFNGNGEIHTSGTQADNAGTLAIHSASTVLSGTLQNFGSIIRQVGGVAGTNEVQITHSGTGAVYTEKGTGSGQRYVHKLAYTNSSGVANAYLFDNFGEFGTTESTLRFLVLGSQTAGLNTNGYIQKNTMQYQWSADGNPVGTPDTGLARNAAGVVKITNGSTGLGSLITGRVNVATSNTPATSSSAGTSGDVCWDASYVYVCTSNNTWKRTAIATW